MRESSVDHPYAAALELGNDGWALAWVAELPGCYAWDLRDAAVLQLPAAIGRYLQAEESGGGIAGGRRPARIVEQLSVDHGLAGGESRALLSSDLAPLSADLVGRAIAWRQRTAAHLRAVLAQTPEAVWAYQPPSPALSLRSILSHVEEVERHGQVMLETPAVDGGDLWSLLEGGHAAWQASAGVERRWERSGESWTPAKVVRRACWHLAWHRDEAAQRVAEWRSLQPPSGRP